MCVMEVRGTKYVVRWCHQKSGIFLSRVVDQASEILKFSVLVMVNYLESDSRDLHIDDHILCNPALNTHLRPRVGVHM